MRLPEAQILLSVFNGQKFLAAQLRSIETQSVKNWICYIRDDSSSDSSFQLIQEFCNRDSRFVLVQDSLGNLGGIHSFEALLNACQFPSPIFFCDQDDIWLEDKLKIILKIASAQEQALWAISSDLILIDENSRLISASFHKHLGYQARNLTLPQLLAQNIFPGCSLCFSAKLKEIALPFPRGIPMHDWWIMLFAAALGQVVFIPQPLVAYRQHSEQFSGGAGESSLTRKFKRAFGKSKRNLFNTLFERFLLWKLFLIRTEKIGFQSPFLKSLSNLLVKKSSASAVFNILSLKIKMQGFLRQVLFVCGIFLYWKYFQKKLAELNT